MANLVTSRFRVIWLQNSFCANVGKKILWYLRDTTIWTGHFTAYTTLYWPWNCSVKTDSVVGQWPCRRMAFYPISFRSFNCFFPL